MRINLLIRALQKLYFTTPSFLALTDRYMTTAVVHYAQTSIICQDIPPSQSFESNLDFLWGKATLQAVDRYAFLSLSPMIIIAELIVLKFCYDNPKILGKPGVLFCIILAFEVLFNIHFLASAGIHCVISVYFTVFMPDQLNMPASFTAFCTVDSILITFFETLHFIFLMMVPLYLVFVLRRTLKNDAKIWTMVYIVILLGAGGLIYLFWAYELIGFNIFGLCGLTFIRNPDFSYTIPVAMVTFNFLFIFSGIFTIRYYKKHMPNSIGLRSKRQNQIRLLVFYVIGYSLFWIVESVTEVLLYFNCFSASPTMRYTPLATVYNILRLFECLFIFFIIFKTQKVRRAFKKFLKKICHRKATQEDRKRLDSFSYDSSSNKYEDSSNFQQILLEIKQQKNEIDILKISQVVTIISGIYIAYKQYYNITDYENIDTCFMSLDREQIDRSKDIDWHRKKMKFKSTKQIYFHQKMTIKINSDMIKDFFIDLSIIPMLGILECTMIVHAPKVFQLMLENDNLESVFKSFQLHDNTKKMFDLVEGQGGRSGQFFFFSRDNKYVLKTITQNELEFIDENLMYFYEHFNRNPDSVLAKIYGLFTFHGNQIQRTYHLILMKNALGCTNEQIVRTYDMKGSRYDREVKVKGIAANELKKTTLKDIDFMKEEGKLFINNQKKKNFQEAVLKDTIFLKNLNIIDYSLLVIRVKWPNSPQNPQFWGQNQRFCSNKNKQESYHIGIIDYLQRWDFQKKGENWWKNLFGQKDISAQEPKKYQQRFFSFVCQITELDQQSQMMQLEEEIDFEQLKSRQTSSQPMFHTLSEIKSKGHISNDQRKEESSLQDPARLELLSDKKPQMNIELEMKNSPVFSDLTFQRPRSSNLTALEGNVRLN